jgi:hypothetical protein
MAIIEPFVLRSLWIVVEEIPSWKIQALSDTVLVSMLLSQVSQRVLLNNEQLKSLLLYLNLKLPLIRDLTADNQ